MHHLIVSAQSLVKFSPFYREDIDIHSSRAWEHMIMGKEKEYGVHGTVNMFLAWKGMRDVPCSWEDWRQRWVFIGATGFKGRNKET